jgi:DNA/RNA endonuclease YhcR with UshA esterase domain
MTKMAIRGRFLALLAGLAVGVAACDEPTAPAGIAGDVVVRAYVDIDGNGTFNAGDEGLQGRTVTLQGVDGQGSHTAATDDSGSARFPGVDPGSYTAHLEGTAPEGARLSSASTPVIVVPFQGGEVTAEFRFVYDPGDLSGVLFRDDDESGDYTPGADAPAPGVTVRLYRGTEVSGEPRATTVTDGQGRFHFEGVRAGPNTLVFDAPETIEIVGGSSQQVQVQPGGFTEVEVRFEGSLLISIGDARERGDGASVEVEGVVTVNQGVFDFNARDTFVQDGTGGVHLWGLDGELGLQEGDSVRVSGVMDTFNDARQLSVVSITELGTGTIPMPRPVTGEVVNGFEYDGQLAVTGPVTVVSVQVFGFDAHNVTVEDEDGTTFIVRMDSPNEIPSEFWEVGDTHVITGVLARFRADGQIKPRGFQDVTGRMDIADARAAQDGEAVFVEGVVLADQGVYDFQDRDTYIQDATGGVRLWQLDSGLGLDEGDSVRVSGTMSTFRNERQLDVASISELGAGTVPGPRPVTGAEINGFEYDGQLAVTGAVTVVSIQVFGFDAHSVTVEDDEGTAFVIRVESPNEIPSDYWVEGDSYRITGVLGRFFDDGQIKPRGFKDVEEL